MLFQVDCEKGEGVELEKRFQAPAYPTFIMLNPAGGRIAAWLGYDGAEPFVARVEAALTDPRTLEEKQAAYDAEPTLALAKTLAAATAAAYGLAGSVPYYKKARELDPDRAADYSGKILQNLFFGAMMGQVTLAEIGEEAGPLQIAAQAEGRHDDVLSIANRFTGLALRRDEGELAAPYLERAMISLNAVPTEERPEYAGGLEVAHALVVEQDKDKALKLKRASLPDGWRDDSSTLNSFAWWCFQNGINQAEALELALRGAELAGDDASRARVLDTAAELAFALGDRDQAVARMEQAVALDPERGSYRDKLARFSNEESAP